MKTLQQNKFYIGIIIFILIPCVIHAAHHYFDQKNARLIVQALDGGTDHGLKIASTYVGHVAKNRKYIVVNFINGVKEKWYYNDLVDRIYQGSLKLINHQSLVLANPETGEFGNLKVDQFNSLISQAQFYYEKMPPEDPLAGQIFLFKINKIKAIDPFHSNYDQSLYHYLMELTNGTKKFLTHQNAYLMIKDNQLLVQQPNIPYFDQVYTIDKIIPYPKTLISQGFYQFNLEIIFQNEINITTSYFPIEIYEDTVYTYADGKKEQQFIMQVTIPNSQITKSIPCIPYLEYLNNICIIEDPRYQQRLLLRSYFDPEAMTYTPVVKKGKNNSIIIIFKYNQF